MYKVLLVAVLALTFTACRSKEKKHDAAALEKYPQCYHKNVKISNKCIEKNEAGENVTALQLENTAYPGQYK
jgi:hypothetical protein